MVVIPSLSDWDTLTVDERGRCFSGTTELSIMGVRLDVCRNWINILDDMAWRPGAPAPRPIVGSVAEGEFSYMDWAIVVVRSERDGCVFAGWYQEPALGPRGMVGISVNGWDGERYVGVRATDVTHLRATLARWYEEKRIPDVMAAVPLDNLMRFNQGDAYVARKANMQTPCSDVGSAAMPMALEHAARQVPTPE